MHTQHLPETGFPQTHGQKPIMSIYSRMHSQLPLSIPHLNLPESFRFPWSNLPEFLRSPQWPHRSQIVVFCTRTHAHHVEGAGSSLRKVQTSRRGHRRTAGSRPMLGFLPNCRLREFAPQPRRDLYGACKKPPGAQPLLLLTSNAPLTRCQAE